MNINQHTARRMAVIGFALGLAPMIALFVYGALQGSAPLMVISSSTAAALASSFTAALVSINRKLKEAQE